MYICSTLLSHTDGTQPRSSDGWHRRPKRKRLKSLNKPGARDTYPVCGRGAYTALTATPTTKTIAFPILRQAQAEERQGQTKVRATPTPTTRDIMTPCRSSTGAFDGWHLGTRPTADARTPTWARTSANDEQPTADLYPATCKGYDGYKGSGLSCISRKDFLPLSHRVQRLAILQGCTDLVRVVQFRFSFV